MGLFKDDSFLLEIADVYMDMREAYTKDFICKYLGVSNKGLLKAVKTIYGEEFYIDSEKIKEINKRKSDEFVLEVADTFMDLRFIYTKKHICEMLGIGRAYLAKCVKTVYGEEFLKDKPKIRSCKNARFFSDERVLEIADTYMDLRFVLSLEEVAEMLGVSYSGVNSCVRKVYGAKYLDRKRKPFEYKNMTPEDLSERAYKVAAAKKRNGTNKHTVATKRKLSKIIKERWEAEPWDTMSDASANKKYKSGYYNIGYSNIFYRSSYELRFLELCGHNDIKIESCDTMKINVRYTKPNGRTGMYRPDFVDLDTGWIYEIKPESMVSQPLNVAKAAAAIQHFDNYVIITERHLKSYEHIFSTQKSSNCGEFSDI